MTKKGALFVVADGMGGHAAGEVASELAVETVSKLYYLQDDHDDVVASLLQAIKRANTLIHQRAAENMLRSGMGTTCVTAILRGSTAYIANVGDSRAYLVRNGQVKQISQDHSWVEEQVRAGLLTRDQARSHAQRNVITRSLGTQAEVDVDIFAERLEEGDTLILCSDGLSGLIADDEMRTIVGKYMPQESVYHLVERANENGGPDNITAIVVRVLEVGWDPYPVAVGTNGREASSAETAIMGSLPTASMQISPKVEDALTQPLPPARLSGPLQPQDSSNASRPALAPSRPKRRRLLIPSIVVLFLLLVAVLGSGVYYFVWPSLFSKVDINGSLSDANRQMAQAKNALSSNNTTAALKLLSNAQKDLRNVQSSGSLSDAQRQKFNTTQSDFISTVQNAIATYNQQSSITVLPCAIGSSNPVNNGSTNTQPETIATLHDNSGKVFRYTLADDHNLYQIDDHFGLVNRQTLPGNPQVMLVAGDDQRLLGLTALSKGNNASTTYSLSTLTPQNPAGALKLNTTTALDPFTRDGQVPKLLAAWKSDAYIILTSPTELNKATILDFPVGDDDKLGNPRPLSISISTSIVSMAAFPDHKLFLLNGDGNIQGLLFGNGSQASSVVVQRPVATPLSASARNFSLKVDVPVPGQPPSSFLSVPDASHATFLATGLVGNTPNLYIADGAFHRVVMLQPVTNTNNNNGTPVAPSPTPGSTGGGQAQSSVMMTLVQQYTSSDQMASIRSIAADPKNPTLYLLTSGEQKPPIISLMTIDVSARGTCAS